MAMILTLPKVTMPANAILTTWSPRPITEFCRTGWATGTIMASTGRPIEKYAHCPFGHGLFLPHGTFNGFVGTLGWAILPTNTILNSGKQPLATLLTKSFTTRKRTNTARAVR
jgi:hypothetical protein